MSKIICSAAIRGAHKIVERARNKYQEAWDKYGPDQTIGFPNTAYYLPIIYSILGIPVKTLGDVKEVLDKCNFLLPPLVRERHHLPYLAPALDAGMATLFAEEIMEAIRYLEEPEFYTKQEEPKDGNIWLGAADDVMMRKRGIEFVDGTAPGFAAIVGAAPNSEIAAKLAQELQEKNLYVFMCGEDKGIRFSEQLVKADVQVGWPTRLVSFGPDVSAAVFAIGFAARVALSFGGIKPGDFRKVLIYNKDRTFAFVMPLGKVTDEWYANAAGAINWGFPTIADTDIPEVLPTGICTYEHVVSNVPHDKIVSKAIEVRGLKVTVTKVPVPVPYGPAFEGERVRKQDLFAEARGGVTSVCEWTTTKALDEVEDGKVEVIGPDLDDISKGSQFPLGIVAEVAGRKMEPDYEPIIERQIHYVINYAHGLMHIGQRDIAWIRISQEAYDKGFRLKHIGLIIHAKFHEMFGRIVDKVQVKLYTEEEKVNQILKQAKEVFAARDARIEGMKDETTDVYYSCTLCVPRGELIVFSDGSFDKIENVIQTVADKQDLEVLSFQNPHFVNKPIGELFFHPAPKKLMHITTTNNNLVRLTPNHKVLVDKLDGLIWTEVGTLKPGDRLLSTKTTNLNSKYQDEDQPIYLVDILPDDVKIFDNQFLLQLRRVILERYGGFGKAAKELGVKYRKLYCSFYFPKTTTYPQHFYGLTIAEIKSICGKVGWDWEVVKQKIRKFGVPKAPGCELKKLILDEEIMYLAGLVASDGCVRHRGEGTSVQFTNSEQVLVDKFGQIIKSLFGTPPKTYITKPVKSSSKGLTIKGRKPVMVSFVYNPLIGKLMMGLGIGRKRRKDHRLESWAGEKISKLSPKLISAFIKGLFDGDGHVTDKHILITTRTYKGAQHLFLLLKKLGISTYITKIKRGYQVGTRNFGDYVRFREVISSNHPKKKKKMNMVIPSFDKNHVVRTDAVPYKCGKILKKLLENYKEKIEITKLAVDYKTIQAWTEGKCRASKQKLKLLLDNLRDKVDKNDKLYQELLEWVESDITFEKVKGVEKVEYKEKKVYNFSVLGTHNYLVNGIVAKNCQSFAPGHVCVISPQRTGLCGAYNWMDCKAAYEMNPTGCNQPVEKGEVIDGKLGQWKGVNEFIYKASRGAIDHYNFYSVVHDPMTTCGCCECVCAVLPLCNGVMTVNREYGGMTPCGMKFTTLAGNVGGGISTPGFVGHSKYNICQRKFISGDGGLKRMVWMPKILKEEIGERLKKRSQEIGIPNLPDMIADETVGVTEEEILPFLKEKNHPALGMEPLI